MAYRGLGKRSAPTPRLFTECPSDIELVLDSGFEGVVGGLSRVASPYWLGLVLDDGFVDVFAGSLG